MLRRTLIACLLLWCVCANASSVKNQQFKSSDGVTLHYLEAGSAPLTLVFVPGWLMPARIFESQIAELSRDYRVIVLDPRGQGRSKAPSHKLDALSRARDVQELLRHAQVGPHVLIGWSLGVMEVLDYSVRFEHPQLRGLVLIDNSIGMASPPASSLNRHRPMKEDDFRAYVKRFAAGMFKEPPPEGMLTTIEASATQLPPPAAWGLLNKPYDRSYYKKAVLAASVPVWYAITPRFTEQSVELLQTHPLASVTVFEGAGHALFVDRADLFNQGLRQFLASTP